MNDLLIRGMEMPTSCASCDIACWHYLYFGADGLLSKICRTESRRPDCPLVPVPPHGRLIDADKQDVQIDALIERHLHGYTKSTWDFVCELRDILKRNYTIIPAEEEKL